MRKDCCKPYKSRCPECNKSYMKLYYERNRESILSKQRVKYYEDHSLTLHKKKIQRDNDINLAKRKAISYRKNKDTNLARSKKWYDKNKERHRDLTKIWKKKNTEKLKEYKVRWSRERYQNDMQHRLRSVLRSRMRQAIKKKSRGGSAINDLGCSIDQLRTYLESKFQMGMCWDNYGYGVGKWNIDHIKPLSSFDLEVREQFSQACHYTNLQPLWHEHNMSKGNK